jgi:hypothetical protein
VQNRGCQSLLASIPGLVRQTDRERERVICEKREEGGLEGAFLVPQKWSNMHVFEAPRRRR